MHRPDSFAQLYHAHHSRHDEDLPFWIDLANELGGPVLELGCGTGRVLIPLAQAGHLAVGLDLDPAMLRFLKDSISGRLAGRIHIFRGDLTRFHLAQRFPLIIMPCNTYSTLSPEQRRQSLGLVRRHLAPGGVFAVSLPNPAVLLRLPKRGEPEVEEVLPHPDDGEPVQVSSEWERDERHFVLRWHYDHLLPDGRIERTTGVARHHLAARDDYLQEMSAAGLQPAGVFGSFHRRPYTSRSPELIILARRPGERAKPA